MAPSRRYGPDVVVEHLLVEVIGDRHAHDFGAVNSLRYRHHFRDTVAFGYPTRPGAAAQPHPHGVAVVGEVTGNRPSLGTVADHRHHGFARGFGGRLAAGAFFWFCGRGHKC